MLPRLRRECFPVVTGYEGLRALIQDEVTHGPAAVPRDDGQVHHHQHAGSLRLRLGDVLAYGRSPD